MSENEAQAFHERVAATAIANQAVLRWMILGMPIGIGNVILCVSDFVDPTDYRFGSLIEQVQRTIKVTVGGATPDRMQGHEMTRHEKHDAAPPIDPGTEDEAGPATVIFRPQWPRPKLHPSALALHLRNIRAVKIGGN